MADGTPRKKFSLPRIRQSNRVVTPAASASIQPNAAEAEWLNVLEGNNHRVGMTTFGAAQAGGQISKPPPTYQPVRRTPGPEMNNGARVDVAPANPREAEPNTSQRRPVSKVLGAVANRLGFGRKQAPPIPSVENFKLPSREANSLKAMAAKAAKAANEQASHSNDNALSNQGLNEADQERPSLTEKELNTIIRDLNTKQAVEQEVKQFGKSLPPLPSEKASSKTLLSGFGLRGATSATPSDEPVFSVKAMRALANDPGTTALVPAVAKADGVNTLPSERPLPRAPLKNIPMVTSIERWKGQALTKGAAVKDPKTGSVFVHGGKNHWHELTEKEAAVHFEEGVGVSARQPNTRAGSSQPSIQRPPRARPAMTR